jgi:hypothetical protein
VVVMKRDTSHTETVRDMTGDASAEHIDSARQATPKTHLRMERTLGGTRVQRANQRHNTVALKRIIMLNPSRNVFYFLDIINIILVPSFLITETRRAQWPDGLSTTAGRKPPRHA